MNSSRVLLFILCSFLLLIGYSLTAERSLLKINEIVVEPMPANADLLKQEFAKVKPDIEMRLKKLKGEFLWEVRIKEVMRELYQDTRIGEVHLMRKLPNILYVRVLPRQSMVLILDDAGDLVPVAPDASLLPALKPSEAPDAPILRGKEFIEDEELRKKAVQMVKEIPEKGVFSREAISEIRHSKKEGFWVSLIQSGVRVKIGEDQVAEKSQRVARVLNYLEAEDLKGRVIDASLSKKVLVKLKQSSQ